MVAVFLHSIPGCSSAGLGRGLFLMPHWWSQPTPGTKRISGAPWPQLVPQAHCMCSVLRSLGLLSSNFAPPEGKGSLVREGVRGQMYLCKQWRLREKQCYLWWLCPSNTTCGHTMPLPVQKPRGVLHVEPRQQCWVYTSCLSCAHRPYVQGSLWCLSCSAGFLVQKEMCS